MRRWLKAVPVIPRACAAGDVVQLMRPPKLNPQQALRIE